MNEIADEYNRAKMAKDNITAVMQNKLPSPTSNWMFPSFAPRNAMLAPDPTISSRTVAPAPIVSSSSDAAVKPKARPDLKVFIPGISKSPIVPGVVPRVAFASKEDPASSTSDTSDAKRQEAAQVLSEFVPFSRADFELPPLSFSKVCQRCQSYCHTGN